MNINGFACGIEMYLGNDVLTKDGVAIPVQWKAFNEKEKNIRVKYPIKFTFKINSEVKSSRYK